MIPLTRLSGVGGKTARKLVDAGIETLGDVANADPDDLITCGIPRKRIEALQQEAYGLTVAFDDTIVYTEECLTRSHGSTADTALNTTMVHRCQSHGPHPKSWRPEEEIDPYRLRRALELKVFSGDAPLYRVVGGSEPHKVLCRQGVFTCDCADFKKGTTNCKHVLAVRKSRGDTNILKLVKRIHEAKSTSIREALPTLWFALQSQEDKR